jgi:CheY-like chemotaxis protein
MSLLRDYRRKKNDWLLKPGLNRAGFSPRTLPDYKSFKARMDMPKKHVLIVDDNAELLEALKDVLEDDYDLDFAANGREAILKFNQHVPAVVLMDYKMPGMDGLETLRCIRTQVKSVPVIMMSAYHEECTVRSAIANGADFYLSKPFDLATVKDAIEKLTP